MYILLKKLHCLVLVINVGELMYSRNEFTYCVNHSEGVNRSYTWKYPGESLFFWIIKVLNFSQRLIRLKQLIYVVWKPANEPSTVIDLKESLCVGRKSRSPHPHGLGAELLTVILTGSLWSAARRWSCRNRKARVRVYCRER